MGDRQMSANRLDRFIARVTTIVSSSAPVPEKIAAIRPALAHLIAVDDWLPETFAAADPNTYQQYLLFCDPSDRFCIVSFVWGAGQKTPIHDHTVWGLIGVLRGAELSVRFERNSDDSTLKAGQQRRLDEGDIDLVSPEDGDIHQVFNAQNGQTSISIHIYGANIGKLKRHVYDITTGIARPFVSGFSNYP
jgi:predicted metal-dependent enzyme (double-stranded beta helix superfamily)